MATKRIVSQNLDVADLPNASPRKTTSIKQRQPEFSNQTWDLPGAHPRNLSIELNKPCLAYTNKDIEKSSP